MWSALYTKVCNGSEGYKPLAPVGVFKHWQQYNYNKSKWGLDKNTELALHVMCQHLKLIFETLYVLRMINALVITTWRHYQARIIKAYIVSYSDEHDGVMPLTQQIRNKFANESNSLDDFVLPFGISLLKYLGSTQYHRAKLLQCNAAATAASISAIAVADDTDLIQHIDAAKAKRKWPIKYNRLGAFIKDKDGWLNKLRKHKTRVCHHTPIRLPHSRTGKDKRLNCTLCSTSVQCRQTRYMCATCEVPLCISAVDDINDDEFVDDEAEVTPKPKACFVLWHEVEELSAEHKKQHKLMCDAKSAKGKKRLREFEDDDADANSDESYSFLNNDAVVVENPVPNLPPVYTNDDNDISIQNGGQWSPVIGEQATQDETITEGDDVVGMEL